MESSNNLGGQGAREIMARVFSLGNSTPVQCGAMTVIWVSTLPSRGGGCLWSETLGEDVVEE